MSEWSDWIEHDGRGCPVEGFLTQMEVRGIGIAEGIAGSQCRAFGVDPNTSRLSAWVWDSPDFSDIIRYRYRKPSGLVLLEQIAANPREMEPA